MSTLNFDQLETLYDELATAIDTAGAEQESVFLAKLVLMLAQEFGNAPRTSEMIRDCLNEPPGPAARQRLI